MKFNYKKDISPKYLLLALSLICIILLGLSLFSEDFMEDGRPEQIQDAILKKYIEEYVISDKAESVIEIMKNLDLTLEQALDALGITGDERMVVVEKYREDFGG